MVTIFLPPLRERAGDIQFLAKAFLEKYSLENEKVPGYPLSRSKLLITISGREIFGNSKIGSNGESLWLRDS